MRHHIKIMLLASLVISITSTAFATTQGTPSITRNPYLQLTTPHSITVRWQTDIPSTSQVQFGPSVGDLSTAVDNWKLTTDHLITLTNLDPNTQYFYSVGTTTTPLAGNDAGHHFTTFPIAGTSQPTRIWVIGDSGTGTDHARAVRDAYLSHTANNPADIWLALGDNAYLFGSEDNFQDNLFDIYPTILRTTTLWPTFGNHDAFYKDAAYFDIFSLPTNAEVGGLPSGTESYYSFDYANIHFVCLDSTRSDRLVNGPMLTWLVSDLAATTQSWIIAYWHHPPYSFGHNSDNETALIEMRQNALPILEAAGVDLVLSGHSHYYDRSFLLNEHYGFSNTLDPSMILDPGNGQEDGDGVYHKPTAGLAPNEGTVYAVAGSSGMITKGNYNHPAMHTTIVELGSMILDVNDNRLDAIFLNDQAVVRDHFTITKGPQPCPADLTNDGSLDFFDVSTFLIALSKQEPIADFNNDGDFDFFDVSEFLTAFAQGCP